MDSLSLAIIVPIGVFILGLAATLLYIVGIFIYGIICKIMRRHVEEKD